MIDFTNSKELFNVYSGSEKKKTLIYENEKYLVKFPDPIREKNKEISYINNSFSEYIGSNIFKICGFETQKTLLGNYNYHGKEKIVCACLDFTDDNHMLYEFEKLALGSSLDKKIDTELSDIIEIIKENDGIINSNEVLNYFWDMFIVDAIIGNTDRHNGNWGFIFDRITNSFKISPIYDCGSCLNPILSDEDIDNMKEKDIKNNAINVYSCLKNNGKKINYMTYIKEDNTYINDAIKRVFPKINIVEIYNLINSITCITDSRKNYYKDIITIRYNIIKDKYNLINN